MKGIIIVFIFTATVFADTYDGNHLVTGRLNRTLRQTEELGRCGDNCQANFDPGYNRLNIFAEDKSKPASMYNYNWTVNGLPPWGNPDVKKTVDPVLEVIIDEGITSIGNYAFYGMGEISSVQIAASVKTIGEFAFSGCRGLSVIDINKGGELKEIGDKAFYQTGVQVVTLPDSVVKIGTSAFRSCEELYCFSIGISTSGLNSLGGYAFKDCTKLNSVLYNGEKNVNFDTSAPPFDKNSVTKIKVRKSYDSNENTFALIPIDRTTNLVCKAPSEERNAQIKEVVLGVINTSEKLAALFGAFIGLGLAIIDLVIAICACMD